MRVLVPDQKKVRLDLIDKKILLLLSYNARFSYATIGKQLHLSREAVKQRITKLQRQHVLLGFQAVIDRDVLGYSSFHIFTQLENPNREKSFIQAMQQDNHVNALIKYTNAYDFEIAYVVKDAFALSKKMQHLSSLGTLATNVFTLLQPFVSRSYPRCLCDFSLEVKSPKKDGSFSTHFKRKKTTVKIDEKDYLILHILAREARISMVDLARKVHTSVDTVIYRIKKLIQGQVIRGFRPIINYAALGNSVYCFLFTFKNYSAVKESMFRTYVQQHKHVLWSTTCLGPAQNISYIVVKDAFEFQDIVQEFRQKFSDVISSYQTLLSFAEYKYTFLPEGITHSPQQ
jgi:Lrp/AsnC family transcriptional regulator, leucine-responsive regulatory protein